MAVACGFRSGAQWRGGEAEDEGDESERASEALHTAEFSFLTQRFWFNTPANWVARDRHAPTPTRACLCAGVGSDAGSTSR